MQEPSREVLLLQDGSGMLLTELSSSSFAGALHSLRDGSAIRVTGISTLEIAGTWNYGIGSEQAVHCRLLLRSPGDIQVLEPPTWWTPRHITYIAISLGLLALVCLIQTIRTLVERWRLQAVLTERERLAHEMHDTLAQSFAGVGFQLQAIRRSVPADLPRLQQRVDLACDLVRHSHKEARRSIEPLYPEPKEAVNLLPDLEHCARQMLEGGSVEVAAHTSGNASPLSPLVATALLRIGQEAIANAVRHADPTHLDIALLYGKNSVTLSVRDDGIGFVKSGDLLGFGLRGMRKRAASISASIEILSQPGNGTSIITTVPLRFSFTLTGIVRSFRNYMRERISNVHTEERSNPNSDC
jgi:signal transduction histidine kinase